MFVDFFRIERLSKLKKTSIRIRKTIIIGWMIGTPVPYQLKPLKC
jgi:hypothetical protein